MQRVTVSETVEVNVVMGAQLRAIVRSALINVKKRINDYAENTGDALAAVDDEMTKWPLSMEGDNDDTLPQWLYNRFGKLMERLDPTEVAKDWDRLEEADRLYWEHEAAAVRRAVGRGGFKTSPEQHEINPVNELNEANRKSGNMVKGYMQLDLKHTESLGEAIRICIGAASTCWENVYNAGKFQPEHALDVATQLEHHVMEFITRGLGEIGARHQALGDHLHKYWTNGVPMVAVSQVRDILTGRATPEEYKTALQVRPNTTDEANRG